MAVHRAMGRRHLQCCFHLANSIHKTALDFGHSITLPEMTGLVEVLEIGAQFLKKFLGKPVTHRQPIVATFVHPCKVTRIWKIAPSTTSLTPWAGIQSKSNEITPRIISNRRKAFILKIADRSRRVKPKRREVS